MNKRKLSLLLIVIIAFFPSCTKNDEVMPVRDCTNDTPFSINYAYSNYDNGEEGIKFSVIINTDLYGLISGYILRYIRDLRSEGYIVDVFNSYGGNPEDLREFLKTRYEDGMAGCLLVGDLPIPLYFTSYCPTHDPVSEIFPCDLFYMDLNGEFSDLDGDCVYDSHTGSIEPDIWLGRLTASNLTHGGADEVSLMKNYFDKNHDYRTSRKKLSDKALVFVNLDHENFYSAVSYAYDDIENIQGTENTCGDQYLEQLQVGYELIQVCSHGVPRRHDFLTSGGSRCSVNYADVVESDPKTFFTMIYGCTVCKYTIENNLGNWYVFTPSYGLAALGSAKSGSQLEYADFYIPFGQGKTIGESFKEWFVLRMVGGFSDMERCCFGGMTLLGDPTLRKQAYMNR